MINQEKYLEFLYSKIRVQEKQGFEVHPDLINPMCKPHQRDTIIWALSMGKCACWKDFGLGKTFDQIEIARIICEVNKGIFLIACPLNVVYQFVEEDGPKLGVKIKYVTNTSEIIANSGKYKIFITNFERVRDGNFDIDFLQDEYNLNGVSLDEGSVLRSFGSETSLIIQRIFKKLPYRFDFTATPAPNDYIEILGQSEFLGIMDKAQAKTRFFSRNSSQADDLSLHPSQEEEFWLWVSSWALMITTPSDLGYSDEGYILPEFKIHWIELESNPNSYGILKNKDNQITAFRKSENSISDSTKVKKATLQQRLDKTKEIISQSPDAYWLIWHLREDERAAIEKQIDDVVTVYGSQDVETKSDRLLKFTRGQIKRLATKPQIAGLGCNFQKFCHNAIFMSIDNRFEDFIQAVHRIYRFLQLHEVNIYIPYSADEYPIVENLKRKWQMHTTMRKKLRLILKQYGLNHTARIGDIKRTFGCERIEVKEKMYITANNDAVYEMQHIEDNSIKMICTSIPFGIQYEYSSSYNDFGHNLTNKDFFKQMDFLIPEMLRVTEPGRIAAIHVKDRILFGNFTGCGFPTLYPFSDETVTAFTKHGWRYIGRITIVTDVVRENLQTRRLGWTENNKDGSKMGVGLPEYVLLFRKDTSDPSNGYADVPVVKEKKDYTRARWQLDAGGFWRSSGNRLLTPEEMAQLPLAKAMKYFNNYSFNEIYNYEKHCAIAEAFDKKGKLPSGYSTVSAQSTHPDVWTDITRIRTLNTNQSQRKEKMHICPLQLDVIERVINRYTNEGDTVADFFAGIGSTGYVANLMNRKAYLCELNNDYFKTNVGYMKDVNYTKTVPKLFDLIEELEPEILA